MITNIDQLWVNLSFFNRSFRRRSIIFWVKIHRSSEKISINLWGEILRFSGGRSIDHLWEKSIGIIWEDLLPDLRREDPLTIDSDLLWENPLRILIDFLWERISIICDKLDWHSLRRSIDLCGADLSKRIQWCSGRMIISWKIYRFYRNRSYDLQREDPLGPSPSLSFFP